MDFRPAIRRVGGVGVPEPVRGDVLGVGEAGAPGRVLDQAPGLAGGDRARTAGSGTTLIFLPLPKRATCPPPLPSSTSLRRLRSRVVRSPRSPTTPRIAFCLGCLYSRSTRPSDRWADEAASSRVPLSVRSLM